MRFLLAVATDTGLMLRPVWRALYNGNPFGRAVRLEHSQTLKHLQIEPSCRHLEESSQFPYIIFCAARVFPRS